MGGLATGTQSASENFWLATPTSDHVNAFLLASELFKIAGSPN